MPLRAKQPPKAAAGRQLESKGQALGVLALRRGPQTQGCEEFEGDPRGKQWLRQGLRRHAAPRGRAPE